MDKSKSWSSKMRMSFSSKISRESIKTSDCSSIECEQIAVMKSSESRIYSSPNIRPIPSFIKRCTSEVHNDIDIPEFFDDFFNKDSKEVLLKYYRCLLRTESDEITGKLYISSNFFCFIVHKKVLKIIIRLSDIVDFKVQPGLFVQVAAHNKIYTFHSFQRPDSAINFLSNFLRLINKKNQTSSSTSTPIISISDTMSTDSSSLVGVSPYGLVNPRRCENHSAPPSCCKVQRRSNAGPPPSNNPFFGATLNPPNVFKTSTPNDSNSSRTFSVIHTRATNAEGNSFTASIQKGGLSLEDAVIYCLSTVSDVAVRVSCIPVNLLYRFVCGGTNGTLALSTQTLGPHPPRSFTKFIAYVVLLFLAISMAYLNYRIETFPDLGSSSGERTCSQELEEVVRALRKLSRLSTETQRLVDSLATSYGLRSGSPYVQ